VRDHHQLTELLFCTPLCVLNREVQAVAKKNPIQLTVRGSRGYAYSLACEQLSLECCAALLVEGKALSNQLWVTCGAEAEDKVAFGLWDAGDADACVHYYVALNDNYGLLSHALYSKIRAVRRTTYKQQPNKQRTVVGTPIVCTEPESEVGVAVAVKGEGDPQPRDAQFFQLFLLFHVEHLHFSPSKSKSEVTHPPFCV
jgi:hypothetical protein